jgi:hypothetical protein
VTRKRVNAVTPKNVHEGTGRWRILRPAVYVGRARRSWKAP